MKKNDILLCLLFSLSLLGPCALYCAQDLAGINVPSWLSSRTADYLSGSIFSQQADDSILEHCNIQDFTSSELQQSIEKKVGGHVPLKGTAMLVNAGLQRSIIATSNLLFGWDCYPTFFGSDVVYLPQENALAYQAGKSSQAVADGLRDFSSQLSAVAEAYPDTQFVVYFAGGYDTPAINLTDNLISDSMTYQDKTDAFSEGLSDLPNVSLLTSSYPNIHQYYSDYYKTDNHFGIDGAITVYNQIAEAAELDAFVDDGERVTIENYQFYGALSRWSLDLIGETVSDIRQDFSNLSVQANDGNISAVTHEALWEVDEDIMPYAFYVRYFDSYSGLFSGGHGTKNAFLCCSSYGGGITRILADNCQTLRKQNDLAGSSSGNTTLKDVLAEGDCDVVVFLATPGDYASFTGRNPDYFKMG